MMHLFLENKEVVDAENQLKCHNVLLFDETEATIIDKQHMATRL